MTIIVFLLDTSASMNQRVFLGGRPSLLDVAKSAVETFVKVRQRTIDSRGDRYMLLTFEEPPSNIKAGWKENLPTFMSELKNLQANGLTTLGNALRHTFDVLNVNRMQHGIDTYGQGRCPFYLEPSIIVCITDGGQLSSNSGVQEELKMHGSSPGFELTREPFRWDQRLFSLVLRMTGQPSGERETGLVPSDDSAIDAMCEVTGGRSYAITTHRMLHQCIDSLVQKVQSGVVLHFEKYGPDPPTIDGMKYEDTDLEIIDEKNGNSKAWHNLRRMIYVPRTTQKGYAGGFWPIAESFWPDPQLPTLPARPAHPAIKFMCQVFEPMAVENFPFDKYELEPSKLTQYILARKQPTVCWQVYVANSSKNNSLGPPIGYLKASTNLTCVNLFVMPYNYPVILPLIEELAKVHRFKPTNEWRAQFAMYLSSIPPYYVAPLKRALIRMGAPHICPIIPEESYLSYSVLNYLKKLKAQAKSDYDRTCSEVYTRVKASEPKRVVTSFKNPFDVARHQLLDHLARLRTHFLHPSQTSALQHESLHNQSIGQMGNYQEYLKRMATPLRELESAPVRQHMFGNPFKIDKRMIIDEADIDLMAPGGKSPKKDTNIVNNSVGQIPMQQMIPMSPGGAAMVPRLVKRKAGPLPKDFKFTPYKNRRMHRGMDYEDSNSDGYLSSAPSSPLALMSPPESPMSFDLVREKETSILDHSPIAPPPPVDYIPKDSRVLEDVEDNLMIVESAPRDVPSMSFGSLYHNDLEMNDVVGNNNDDNDDAYPPDEHYPPGMNGGSNSSNSDDVKPIIIPPPPDNGLSLPVVVPVSNHVNSFSSTNHVGLEKNKVKKEKVIVKAPPPASNHNNNNIESRSQPPPVEATDDENTFKKNLSIRVDLHKEIRRPVLRMDYILGQLTGISGSYETKNQFVRDLAREALRFKRKQLAKALTQQADFLAPFCRPSPS